MLVKIYLVYFQRNKALGVKERFTSLVRITFEIIGAIFSNQCLLGLFSALRRDLIFDLIWRRRWSRIIFFSGRQDDLIWASKRFFFFIRFIDNFVPQLWPAKFGFGGSEWPNRVAASAQIVDSRWLSFSNNVLVLESLLWTVSSSCNQCSWVSLPQAIGGFTCICDRSISSFVWGEHVFWVFSWLDISILSFPASQNEKMSTKTTLQFLNSELGASAVDWGGVLSQKLVTFLQKFEVLVMGWWFRIII